MRLATDYLQGSPWVTMGFLRIPDDLQEHTEDSLREFLRTYVEQVYELSVLAVVVRSPERDDNFKGAACMWHHDAKERPYFIAWAERDGTQYTVNMETFMQQEPWELVLVDNDKCQHKKPDVSGRWFARVQVL